MRRRKYEKHGASYSLTYASWENMKARCLNPKQPGYEDYGGAGITICSEWSDSFEAFLRDMGERPSAAHTIDRKRGELGYYKDNCRWATKKEQARNRKSCRAMTLNGVTRCVTEWAEALGIESRTLMDRVYRGWSDEKALTTPVGCAPANKRGPSPRYAKSPPPGVTESVYRNGRFHK